MLNRPLYLVFYFYNVRVDHMIILLRTVPYIFCLLTCEFPRALHRENKTYTPKRPIGPIE